MSLDNIMPVATDMLAIQESQLETLRSRLDNIIPVATDMLAIQENQLELLEMDRSNLS